MQQERDSNMAASQILSQMIIDGEAEQDGDGNVRVSKKKSDAANVIGNLDAF